MATVTLADAIRQYGRDAFLLTISRSGPHTSQVVVELQGNKVSCAIGTSAAKNIASEPNVSVFWPPQEPGGYAIIVNGLATATNGASGVTTADITLTKSVFHRAGPRQPDSNGPCASDCRQLARTA